MELSPSWFMPTSEVAFEIDLFRKMELNLYRHSSFEAQAEVFNIFHRSKGGPNLDRKVLSEGYFRFLVVSHLQDMGTLATTNLNRWDGLDTDLLQHQSNILRSFSIRWGSHHLCNKAGCRMTAVGDGHMKCHR